MGAGSASRASGTRPEAAGEIFRLPFQTLDLLAEIRPAAGRQIRRQTVPGEQRAPPRDRPLDPVPLAEQRCDLIVTVGQRVQRPFAQTLTLDEKSVLRDLEHQPEVLRGASSCRPGRSDVQHALGETARLVDEGGRTGMEVTVPAR